MLSLTQTWYSKSITPLAILLMPFSWLFGLCAALRRFFYRIGIFKTYHFNVPVIVVGNLTVGGTGKTPFVIELVKILKANGFHPGIVSRGVGGKKHVIPHQVQVNDTPDRVGDEALLLKRNTGCSVVISVDRVAAVRELLKHANCNIVISDDGLQHYRLGRKLEIVMMDGERQVGNKQLLPAGPLREPVSRLNTVDFVVTHVGNDKDNNVRYTMSLQPVEFVSVMDTQHRIPLTTFARDTIHAVAGIGHPQRFFMTLKDAGFDIIPHVFPDHHAYQANELSFTEAKCIVMTEKDAVKCVSFADERYWYLSVTAKLNHQLQHDLLLKLKSLEDDHEYEKDFAMYTCRNSYRIQCDPIRKQK